MWQLWIGFASMVFGLGSLACTAATVRGRLRKVESALLAAYVACAAAVYAVSTLAAAGVDWAKRSLASVGDIMWILLACLPLLALVLVLHVWQRFRVHNTTHGP